ncbi:MAG: DNA-binding protein [Paenibacillus sp.]|nr:DNA-binding protein [Paenibacillus sp.]
MGSILDEGTDWDKYPMTLRPKHIEQIMKMSQKKTYEFLSNPPFHVAMAGREKYISKMVFRNWLEGTNLDIFNKVKQG